jgi:endonuclease/exonuclease/phosphatase family metal-dependent hydrolase
LARRRPTIAAAGALVIRRRDRLAAEADGERPLVVATYNIHSCVGVDRRHDPERVAAVLRELRADIIGLQEVGARPLEQWEYLAAQTGLHGVAGANVSDPRGRFGNALLTRFPVEAVRHIDLSVSGHEPRGAIAAELLADGRRLCVLVTHLGLHAAERRWQIHRLLDWLPSPPKDPEALVVLGDLNEWRGGVSALDRRLGRAPMPRTFPSWLPVLPLDRIYAAGALRLRRVAVHRSALARVASDHLPLQASLAWRATRPGSAAPAPRAADGAVDRSAPPALP